MAGRLLRWRKTSAAALATAQNALLAAHIPRPLRWSLSSPTVQLSLPSPRRLSLPSWLSCPSHTTVSASLNTLHVPPAASSSNFPASNAAAAASNAAAAASNAAAAASNAGATTLGGGGPGTPGSPPVVIVHGYGAGLGFFFPNFADLARAGVDTYAVDWPGMGGSSREPQLGSFLKASRRALRCVSSHAEALSLTADAEAVFVSALDSWRDQMGLESMTLVGHSMGGALAAAYAETHPDRLAALVLASPAGVTRVGALDLAAQASGADGADGADGTSDGAVRRPAPPLSMGLWMLGHMFSRSTVQGIVRALGPYGERMVTAAVHRRFPQLTPRLRESLAAYLYHVTASDGAGEYLLNVLFDLHLRDSRSSISNDGPSRRGLVPLSPLLPRLEAIPSIADGSLPLSLLYGDSDWMFTPATAADIASSHQVIADALVMIPSAGHHLYLDNAPAFTDHIISVAGKAVPRA